ncbi:MAG: LUD domain-containing protein, partial [Chloroflexota bacterium]
MLEAKSSVSELIPNQEFAKQASDERIQRTAKALEANGIRALIAENGEEARRLFFELVPEGSEIFLGASVTLETIGIQQEIDKSGKYDAIRPKTFAMNRETQEREIRKLRGGPDYAAGSVHAVTEDGQVLIASKTGSQLGPYASGAGKVIWVVG